MALRDVPRFEFIVRDAPWSFAREVHLVERTEGATYLVTLEKAEKGDLVLKRNEVPKDNAITTPPLFRLHADIAPAVFAALVAALDSQVTRPSEDRLAGQLEAIREHLKDMRRLVFEPGTERIVIEKAKEEHHGS